MLLNYSESDRSSISLTWRSKLIRLRRKMLPTARKWICLPPRTISSKINLGIWDHSSAKPYKYLLVEATYPNHSNRNPKFLSQRQHCLRSQAVCCNILCLFLRVILSTTTMATITIGTSRHQASWWKGATWCTTTNLLPSKGSRGWDLQSSART